MTEEGEEVSVQQVVDQISNSLMKAIPEIILRLKALADKNQNVSPEILRSVEGVAKAGDALAETCTDLANDEYEEYPDIKKDIQDSARTLIKSSVTLRRAAIMLNQARSGDRSPAYHDVMEASTAISVACVHVLDVVYGSFYRRALVVSNSTCDLMRSNSEATLNASFDDQKYANTVSDWCSKANVLASNLASLAANERDDTMASKFYDLSSRVQEASNKFLDDANAYLGDLSDSSLRDAAQKSQDALLSVMIEAGALLAARNAALQKKDEKEQPEPQVEQVVEDASIPERASLASQIPPIQTPLTYLMLVAEQKRQCDLVDDLLVTAKSGMRQAMVENARAIVQRHTVITVEAGNLCTCDMARDAVDATAEEADVQIRNLVKCSNNVLENPEDDGMKKILHEAASAYKIIVMKYSDDCLLKPDEGRELTVCQRLRIAVTEGHPNDEILSLLEDAIGAYNYRAERVQDDDMKEDLLDAVRSIGDNVRDVTVEGGDIEEKRGRALDSMDVFENIMIAYLLSLVEKALQDTAEFITAINSKNKTQIDAGSGLVLGSVSEVSTETRDIADEYTGCVEGTQNEFDAAAKRVDEALQELIAGSRAVKADRTTPQETVPQQKELVAALHHVEELCKRAQYKRIPPKKRLPEPEPVPEPESVLVERKTVVEKEEKVVEKEEKVVEKEKEEKKEEKEKENKEGSNQNILLIAILVLLVIIIIKLF